MHDFALNVEVPADSCVLVQMTLPAGTVLFSVSVLTMNELLSSLRDRCPLSSEPGPSPAIPWTLGELGPSKPAAQPSPSAAGNITLISWLQALSL